MTTTTMTNAQAASMTSFDCPLCQCSGELLLKELADGQRISSLVSDVVYCRGCEMGFTIPILSEAELSEAYPSEYTCYSTKENPLLLVAKKYRLARECTFVSHCHPGAKDLFEIGVGAGEFLQAAKEKGWHVAGVEPSEHGRNTTQGLTGITVQSGYASQFEFKQKYDVVAIRHALEHVLAPDLLIEKIMKDGLRPGGLIYIKVPRFDSWELNIMGKFWHGLDVPRHRYHFSSTGLKKMLERAGFSNVQVHDDIVPNDIARFLPYWFREKGRLGIKISAWLVTPLPRLLAYAFGTLVAYCLAPLGAGRMVLTGAKPIERSDSSSSRARI